MLSCALFYAPWLYELEQENKGWVSIDQLLEAFKRQDNKWDKLTISNLQHWIDEFEAEDYEIRENKIRMYSTCGEYKTLSRKKTQPPAFLYHVTDAKCIGIIMHEGLRPMDRRYVHLVVNEKLAHQVGMCKASNPVIFSIDTSRAYFDGVIFYQGNEKEWLADYIPPQYIQKISPSE